MKKIFIGIDFAKEKFDVCLIEACGLKEFGDRRFGTFDNNPKGFRSMMKWIKSEVDYTDWQEWIFCGEDTGAYSVSLAKWLYGKGMDMWLENPYAIKHSAGLQRLKTDKADASLIAEYVWRHQDKAVLYQPMSESLESLREVFLYRQKLVQQRVAMEIRQGSKESSKSKGMSFVNRKSRHLVDEINKVIKECDQKIDSIIESDPELKENYGIVTSIKGISRQNGACMLIYTNNFKKFGMDAGKIACYYGVAPFAHESGKSVKSPSRVSHFANKLIKSLLGQAAHIAKIHNPEMKDYYNRMIDKGKKPQVALNNLKNKLLRIIVALVRKKERYDPQTYKSIMDKYETGPKILIPT